MAKRSAVSVCFVVIAIIGASHILTSTFVPPPVHRAASATGAVASLGAATAAATMGAAPALSDEIGDAAKKLASASYPFLKDIDWNSKGVQGLALTNPGKASALEWTKAIGKAIDMGASMDSSLLQKGVQAHHEAIGSMDAKGVTSLEDYERVLAALGRMIASVSEDKVMAVYTDFGKLVDPAVPAYLMKTVKEADAQAAYKALLEFKDVVKANPIRAAGVSTDINPKIDQAANKLADAAYPFLKSIDWSSDLPVKTSGFSLPPSEILKAVDKALVMGASIDGAALKEAAQAHVKAINNMDAKGVTTKADFAAILSGLGKVVASVSSAKVLGVYNAFGDVVNAKVPQYLMSTVKAQDAVAAYNGFLEFKDVVRLSEVR